MTLFTLNKDVCVNMQLRHPSAVCFCPNCSYHEIKKSPKVSQKSFSPSPGHNILYTFCKRRHTRHREIRIQILLFDVRFSIYHQDVRGIRDMRAARRPRAGGAENARLENAGLELSGTGNVWNATCGIT